MKVKIVFSLAVGVGAAYTAYSVCQEIAETTPAFVPIGVGVFVILLTLWLLKG
jgi:hypothetical protein